MQILTLNHSIKEDRGKDMLEDFIKYCKYKFNVIITLKPSDNPDTFKSVFGFSKKN